MPLLLFGVLAVATVGAFYLTQHLKVANPLINGGPHADPAVINPRYAGVCADAVGKRVSFRRTAVGFYLQSRSDTVFVSVLNADNEPVATMQGSGRHITAGLNKYAFFYWNGQLSDGRYAPTGTYTFQVALQQEGRTFRIPDTSVRVESGRPAPRITAITVNQLTGAATTPGTATGVSPSAATATGATATGATKTGATKTGATKTGATTTGAATSTTAVSTTQVGTTPYFAPGTQTVTLDLADTRSLGADVLVYRASTNPSAPLKLVKTFGINSHATTAVWDGMIAGRPAPAGTYLLGLSVTDASCTTGRFPQVLDPAPGSTDGAGVDVSYLSANPPMDPVPAGQLASVGVQAGGGSYTWALRGAGQSRVIFHGIGTGDGTLRVRLPGTGLYELTIVSDGRRTTVPLVASAVGARAAAKVLVVLPALSWQGANPTDDDSDGLPDTLTSTGQVSLGRPLVAGLPGDVPNEAGLLNALDAQGLSYDVTTDVALAEGVGPGLRGRSGVLLDGQFTWLPAQLVSRLRGFVHNGGGVFADGVRSLQAKAAITDGSYGPIAGPARPMAADPFGVKHGTVSPSYGQLVTSLTDGLHIFGTDFTLDSSTYQVLDPSSGTLASAAGVAQSAPAVIGFHLGAGTVVEGGLPDFGAGLASDPEAAQLLSRVWQTVLNR